MNTYKHTQTAKLLIIVMSVASLVMIVIGTTLSNLTLLLGLPVLLGVAWLFHSMTIEIVGGELRWRFGPGLIRKRVQLAQIASAEPVRTNFPEGWGIHWSRFGWLYNVSGYDAVAVTLSNGKRFALGTDEPQTLSSKLREVLKGAPK